MNKRKKGIRSRMLSIILALSMILPGLISPLTVQASGEYPDAGVPTAVETEKEGFIFSIEDYSTGEGQYILEPTRVETGYDGTNSQNTHVMLNRALDAAGMSGIRAEKGPQIDWWIEYISKIGELETDASSYDGSSGDLTSNKRWEVSFNNKFGTTVFVGKEFKYDAAHKNSVIRAMYTANNGADIGATDKETYQLSVNKDELLRTIADARAEEAIELAEVIANAEAVALGNDGQEVVDAMTAELKAAMDTGTSEPEEPKKATVTFSAERFTIGQGYLVEPVTVEVTEGDPVVSVIKKVFGEDRLDLNSGDNYLASIKDADLGADHVVVPEYITKISDGTVTTESVREYGNEDYEPGTLGEFSYHYQSGWFYFLNNEDPGIGIGQQTVKDGDVIRLQFTLYGLGKDLTGKGYGESEASFLVENKDSITKLMAQVNESEKKIKENPSVVKAYKDAADAVAAMLTSKEDLAKAEEALAKAVKDAEEGKITEGWGKDGSYDIYTKADGSKATSEFLNIDGKIYYFDAASHKYATPGFKALNTIWYYFNQDGSLVTGWKSVGSVWYYFNKEGEMQKGWQQIDGHWYFFNGSGAMIKGWLKEGSNWFYFNGSGQMVTGWQAIGGKWYYFYDSGRMLTGWQKIDGHWYYLKSSGEMTKGWLKDGGKWFYFNGSGHMMTGWQVVSGKWYYFFDSGRMATGWLQEGGHWYYLKSSGEMTKGWLKDGSNWFYFNGSGHMLTGKQKIDGKWYNFRASGALAN